MCFVRPFFFPYACACCIASFVCSLSARSASRRVALFVLVDVLIVAYRFQLIGGGPAMAPDQPTVEAVAPEVDKPPSRPAEIEGVRVKEGVSEGLGAPAASPAPLQRPIEPPEM